MAHAVRPIQMQDTGDISALLDHAWFPARSEAGWRWLCRTPRSLASRAVPAGFVAEDGDGRVAGVFGLFTQDYSSRQGSLSGGTGHTLIVHPRIRGASRPLIDAVLDQPSLFAVTVLHSNDLAAPIYRRHGMVPFPVGRDQMSLMWVTDPLALLAERAARASKAHLGREGRPTREWLLRDRVFGTELTHAEPRVRTLDFSGLDQRIDAFAAALAAEGRLMARRDAAALRWRFVNPDRTRDPILLAWIEGEAIGGLLLAEITKVTQIDAPTLEIIDLVAVAECADHALPALVLSLVRNAARLGCARVRLPVVPQELERRLESVPGMLRRHGHDHGFAWIRPGTEGLVENWRLTPYDGEFGVCFRPPPRPQRLSRAA